MTTRCDLSRNLEPVDAGTGDVFVDLGFDDAGERKLRVQFAIRVNEIVKGRKLTQTQTANVLGISRSNVSDLKNFKLNRFSSKHLRHVLTVLDQDVVP